MTWLLGRGWRARAWFVLRWAERALMMARLLNQLIFLWEGKYSSVRSSCRWYC